MIYIYGPAYASSSNGIKCMYYLACTLLKNGIETRFVCCDDNPTSYGGINPEHFFLYNNCKFELTDDDIALYTDVVNDNPLNAKRIIRWLCNKPYVLTGDGINYGDNELVISYSTIINSRLPQLFVLVDERKLFESIKHNTKKDNKSVCVYFGKVHERELRASKNKLESILKDFERINVITRQMPQNHKETLQLLASSELLISFDPLTNLNYESTLLGTPVLLMDDTYGIKNITFNVNDSGFVYDYEDYMNARKDIKEVYKDYCRYLDNQEKIICESVLRYIKMLENISQNETDREKNSVLNEKLMIDDLVFYRSMSNEQFSNIDYQFQIPKAILKLLVESGAEIDNRMKNGRELYYKIPGDLTIPELFFLIVRRVKIAICSLLNGKH